MYNMQPSAVRPPEEFAPPVRPDPRSSTHRASDGARHFWVLAGWLLMMPPVPLGTSLPPLSAWSQVSKHESSDACEHRREAMRTSARKMIGSDPNASALRLAGAFGALQASCVEGPAAAQPVAEPAVKPDSVKPVPAK